MMQPMDPLSQLAMCCGLGNRRRDHQLKPPRNLFYSPSHAAQLNHHESSWALANHTYAPQQPAPPQPYLLLTQPVIITTTNPSGLNQTNHTMTLVQHAQTAQNPAGFPYFSLVPTAAHQPQLMHSPPNLVTSQYAIYNSVQQPVGSGLVAQQASRLQALQEPPAANQSIYSTPKSTIAVAVQPQSNRPRVQQSGERKVATLSSEVFRQLELIEKQVDLSADMDTVERYGIVITRALDPYSLVPHLKESTLREYNEQYLRDDSYVVRFIEIIKRPGQTLGLYIRTICFEDAQGRGSRAGVVITKIDTDSPVYNSPILHVGDEILSINLVDVSGMSLDNVVVIMSIPRRLVLALRIPRDRLLDVDFIQEQQQQQQQQQQLLQRQQHPQQQQITMRDPVVLEQQEVGVAYVDRPAPPRAQSASLTDYHQRYQMGNPQTPNYDQSQLVTDQVKQPVISNLRLGDTPEQSSYFSSSIDAINRELKELRRQRMALSNNEQNLDSSSSTRVDF